MSSNSLSIAGLGKNVLGLGSSMCKGPGAGMLVWPECREGGRACWIRWEDALHEDEFGSLPLYLFSLHFSSLLYTLKKTHYGLASFKCI